MRNASRSSNPSLTRAETSARAPCTRLRKPHTVKATSRRLAPPSNAFEPSFPIRLLSRTPLKVVALWLRAHDDLESAVAKYREILTNWPDTFTARRQHLNIGRVSEKLGQTEDAVQAYRDQLAAFPESHVAADAQKALARLNAAHPELFAAAAEEETEPAVDAADTAGAVEPADDSGGMAMPTPQLTIPTEAPSQKADAPEAEAEPAAAE